MILKGIINIGFYSGETSAVKIALNNLKNDIKGIMDADVRLVKLTEKEKNTEDINILVATGDIKVFDECVESPEGTAVLNKWEGYVIKEHGGVLYINGTDKRGTIYGIYEMSKYFGVSPWYYFADVPVRKKDVLIIPKGFFKADYPSVQYRGIFINDEEELEEWAVLHTKDGTIGPQIYEKIYELILRLKGNYLWPAMHVNYFQENPKNAWLANEMGIVIGTSHCDMLMRSNQNEWTPWLKKNGYRSDYNAVHSGKLETRDDKESKVIYYDYSIPGKNREIIRQYWRESVEMNKDYEVCYTIGMRGVHDYGFSTKAIDEDITLSEDEKLLAKIRLLENIMEDQRQMIKTECGLSSAADALQSFIPYKEVLELYNTGLKVPDDVTLIWVNDNFGHIRRYPDADERKRTGGHGLYFHASYWGTTDMSYLFFNTMPLAHITNELRKAYTNGIRKMWVLNAGAIKPLEMDIEVFLDYAWDAGKETTVTYDIHSYTADWFDSYFSGGFGYELADIYEEYVQLTDARKIEHMQSMVFAQSGYGDEAGERLCRIENVFKRANEIYGYLPDEEKEAFFQMFLFKIHASYYVNHAFYYADRSIISYDRGNNMAADMYTDYSHKMMQYLKKMLRYYNEHMSGGKWNKILTPDSFPPPGICFYPPCRPSIKRSELNNSLVKAAAWDGCESTHELKLRFYSSGTHTKWIEIGNPGVSPVTYDISGKPEWLDISEESGMIYEEKRIDISVKNHGKNNAEKNKAVLNISIKENGQIINVDIVIETIHNSEETDCVHYDADGAVCIYATECEDNERSHLYTLPLDEAGWYNIYGIGRDGGNAVMAYNPMLTSMDGNIIAAPHIDYAFMLNIAGEYELGIVRLLTLDEAGLIRFGIGIDGKEPFTVETSTNDEWRGNWHDSVMSNGEFLYVKLPYLDSGRHTISLYMIDNYVTIHKLVIYTEDRKDTYYGFQTGHYTVDEPGVDWNELDAIREKLYLEDDTEIIPDMVYADKEFWKYNRIYMKNELVPRSQTGQKRYETYYSDKKTDDIISLFESGMFTEKNGIIVIDTEYVLAGTENAYLTCDVTGKINWSHVRSQTYGGTGLAMMVYGKTNTWSNATDAPGMHYRINVSEGGTYNVWLLILYENHMSDSCYFALDGEVLPQSIQYNNGQLCHYATLHMYYWCLTCCIDIPAGEHMFSVYACDTGLSIDRIYMSRGEERPPVS